MAADVAVVVGVYNGERFLRELLDSVLAQTCGDWTCVCVDDGSTDSSAEILADYAARDMRFRVFFQANAGVGAARNAALDRIGEPFVMFADQDDRLAPDAVERALAAAGRTGADIVHFRSNRGLAKSPFVWEHVFRREAIGATRFPPITGGEDTAFLWELDLRGLKRAAIDDVLYFNRPNSGSFSRTVTPRYVENAFAGYREMRECARRHGLSGLWLWRRLFPHVFWFSLSVLGLHFTPANAMAIARGVKELCRG